MSRLPTKNVNYPLIITIENTIVPSGKSIKEAADGILHQAGDGHGAHAARHGRDGRCLGRHGIKVHVAAEGARFRVPIHAHVDDHAAGGDHVSGDHFGAAGRYHKDFGPAGFFGQVHRARVAQGDGGVGVLKNECMERTMLTKQSCPSGKPSSHSGASPSILLTLTPVIY